MRVVLLRLFLLFSVVAFGEVLPPGATISINATAVCQNAASPTITITASGGTAPYAIIYQINGGANQTVNTNNSGVATLSGSTNTVGNVVYTLISVQGTAVTASDSYLVVPSNFAVNAGSNSPVCKGNAINLTASASNTGGGTVTYSWTGPNGFTSSLQNPVIGNAQGAMSGVYTVRAKIGDCEVTDTVNVQVVHVSAADPSLLNGCLQESETTAEVVLNLVVSNPSNTISVSVNWGDGVTETIPASSWGGVLVHTYTVGYYTVTITATTNLGCTLTQTYTSFVGSSPQAATLSLFANQANGCSPHNTNFTLSIPTANNDGTHYRICFGDENFTGASCIEYTHGTPVPSNWILAGTAGGFTLYTLAHTYNLKSCGNSVNLNNVIYNNVYLPSVITTNPCTAPQPQAGSLISVGIAPDANFIINPDPSACVNSAVTFTNTSDMGGSINPANLTCTSTSPFYWTISPNTSGLWTASGLGSNNNGSSNHLTWTSGSMTPSVTFHQPGIYTITLTLKNSCGQDTISKQICIEPPLAPQFTLNTTTGCSTTPVSIAATNTTSLTNMCGTPEATWSVVHTPGFCGGTTATFPDQTTANANWSFTLPGTYQIRLTMSNSCGSPSVAQTVTILSPPTASIANIPDFCSPGSVTPTATVNSCGPTTEALTYNWQFPGGTPSSSTAANPGAVSYTTAGSKTITLVVTNSCGNSTTATETFNVNDTPQITNTDLTQNLCSGVASNAVNLTATLPGTSFSWTTTAGPNISGHLPSGSGNTLASHTLIYTGSGTGTVTYTVTPTLNGCTGTPVVFQFTVSPAPQITQQPASQTLCQGGTASALNINVSATGTPQYQWYSNIVSNTTSGSAISGATSQTYVPPATTVGTMYYYAIITLASGGCSQLTSQIAAITVEPLPSISLHPTPAQQICEGGSIPMLSVAATGGTGTATYQWFTSSGSNSGGTPISGATNADYTPPVFATDGDFYYYATVTYSGSGCGTATSAVAHVEVLPDPVIDTQPIASQILCQGASAQPLAVAASGGLGSFTYQWYSNGSNSTTGATAIPSATSATYTPDASAIGTRYYYVVVSQSAPGCQAMSAIVSVTVNTSPSVSVQPQPQTVCLNGATSALTFATINGAGTATYQWYSNSVNNTTSGTSIAGATADSYTPPATAEGVIYYYATITFSGITGACATITTNAVPVTVLPLPQITTQPQDNQTVCVGATLASALTVAHSTATGTVSYQWYRNTTDATTGGSLIPGATSDTYLPDTFTTPGPNYFYVTITFNGSGCGAITSDTALVDVLADPVVTVSPSAEQILCEGAPADALTVAVTGGSGTNAYQWYSNTTAATTGGTLLAGEINPTFTPPSATVEEKWYYCVVTQDVAGCQGVSASVKITVNTAPSVSDQPDPAEVCVGGTVPALTFTTANGEGNATYQWFSSPTSAIADGTAISGENNPTYQPDASTVSQFWYFAQITFDGITGPCATITTVPVLVNVTPAASITTEPTANQTLCVGGSVSVPLTFAYTGGSGTATFQWFENTSASNTGGTAISGATSQTYTPSAFTTSGPHYFYAEVTLSANGCGAVATAVATVDVIPDPVISLQPLASQTVCQGETPQSLSITVGGGVETTYVYQWFESTTNTPGSGTAISGANADTYLPDTSATGTKYYYVEITQPTDFGCNATSAMAEVIVSPAPEVTVQPLSADICIGNPATALNFTVVNGVGTPDIQWFSNVNPGNTGGAAVTGATSATYLPDTTIAGVMYYYAEIRFPDLDGSCSTVITDAAKIEIFQNPVITDISDTICSSATFTITPITQGMDIVPAGTTYTWGSPVITPAGSITGASAEGTPQTQISQTLINTTTAPATVLYTVIPVSGSCPGNPFSVVVTVNPAISPNVTVNDNLCFGADSASIVTNVTGGIPFPGASPYQFTWTGPDGFSSSAASISNLAPGTYSVTILDQGGCPFSESYVITEPTQLVVDSFSETDVTCFAAANGTISIQAAGGTPPYSYQWTKDTATFSSDHNLVNLAPGIYEVTISDANSCGPVTQSFTITEPPLLEVTLSSQINVECFGQNTGAISVSTIGGTPVETSPGVFGYTYAWSGPSGFVSSDQNLTNIYAGTYDLVVTDNNGCQDNLQVVVTEFPEIIIAYTTTPISCYGANDATMTVTLSGGNAPYTFTWSNLSTSLTQTNLSADSYTITVVDSFGCVKQETIVIPEAPVFMIDPVVTQISCHGENDGSIQLNLTGGISPVVLVWSDGSTDGLTRNGLPPGTYTATITDSKPCVITRTFVIVEPQPLAATANVTDALDCTVTDSGAIDLIVSGGTPPYAYAWSNGATTEDLTHLTNGNYAVEVVDSRGCRLHVQYTINRPDPLAISIDTRTTADCEAKTVRQQFFASVTGGFPPYALSWSSGTISGANNEIMETATNGTVILTVVDASGCTVNYSVNVDIPVIGEIDFNPDSFGYLHYGIYSIHDPVTFLSDIDGDFESVFWDFGDGTFSSEVNPVHTYVNSGSYVVVQTVRFPFGCEYKRVITLVVEQGYFLTIPTAFTPNNDHLNDNYKPVHKRLQNLKLEVYDSWGSIIYSETGDTLVGWDGKIKDVPAENGNYYCNVTAQTFYGTTITESRTFVLIK